MHFDKWWAERTRRALCYEEACGHSKAMLAAHDRGEMGMGAVGRAVRECDRAYLAWDETIRWPVEYDGGVGE